MAEQKRNRPVEAGMVETPDGARLYYESAGDGPALLLVPCWMGTTRFWRRQADALSAAFRVVSIDPRAHGNSSKVLHGHTVPQYAKDIRTVIEALSLSRVVLVGWSISGSVVLQYWKEFGDDRLRAVGLVDVSPFPFCPEGWNGHGLRGYNYDAMNESLIAIQENRKETILKQLRGLGVRDEDLERMAAEMMKTPAPAAAAVYSDFAARDLTPVLGTISAPAIVWAAESSSRKDGVAMGRHIASRIPGALFVPFARGGHFLNYNEPEEFNASLARFADGLK